MKVLLFLLYCFFVVEIYSLSIGTYLFLDDTLIKSSNGLFFEQHQPTKKGQVIAPEYEWESGIYFYTSALKVSDYEYRLYYTCIGQYNIEVNTINLCMANSTDGITFEKPFLGVIGYGSNNNTANNIVFSIPYSKYGGWPNTVWMDLNPNIPQVEKFKLTYDVNDSTRYLRIAASPDGIHWTPIAQPGVADKFADTQSVIVWNLNTGHYVAYGRDDYTPPNTPACPGNAADYRRIALAISSTNVSEFGPAEVVFSWDPTLDPPCLDPYNPATLLYPTDPFVPSFSSPLASPPTSGFVPNVYLLFPAYTYHLSNSGDPYTQQFGVNDNLLDIHFIFSHNGRNFSYVTKEPFIPRGFGYRNLTSGMFDLPNSEWDAGMVFMTRGIFVTPSNPNTLTLYYYGSQMTHAYAAYIHNALYNQPKGLGRAEIRRDGFVSLTTQYNLPMPQASLLTVPIEIPEITECGNTGIELQLNIETSVSGFVTVEILDSNDQPIPGYTADECVPIKGNFVRVPVFWNSNGGFYSDLTKLAGNTVSLSFSMSHTKLYAIEFVCSSQSFP